MAGVAEPLNYLMTCNQECRHPNRQSYALVNIAFNAFRCDMNSKTGVFKLQMTRSVFGSSSLTLKGEMEDASLETWADVLTPAGFPPSVLYIGSWNTTAEAIYWAAINFRKYSFCMQHTFKRSQTHSIQTFMLDFPMELLSFSQVQPTRHKGRNMILLTWTGM